MVIDPDGPLDRCGQRGCVEVYCGGRALSRRAGEGAAELFGAAAAGEREALELVADATRHMGTLMVNVANLYDPEMIVMGGGVTRSWGVVAPALRAALADSPFITPQRRPLLRRARLGDAAGLRGALEWARDSI